MDDLKTVPLVAVDETGNTTELMATLPVAEPAAQPVQVAAAETHTADRTVEAETPAPAAAPAQTLPHTASPCRYSAWPDSCR